MNDLIYAVPLDLIKVPAKLLVEALCKKCSWEEIQKLFHDACPEDYAPPDLVARARRLHGFKFDDVAASYNDNDGTWVQGWVKVI